MILYNHNKTADGSYYKALTLYKTNNCEAAKTELNTAFDNFNQNYYNKHDYTEALYQIYIQDLEELKTAIETQCPLKKEIY